jgi:hypothetical protein
MIHTGRCEIRPRQILGCPTWTLQHVNTITVVSQTEVQTSPHRVMAHRLPQVHSTGGSRETTQGIWQALALEKDPQHCGSSRHGLEKDPQHCGSSRHGLENSEHPWHRWGLVYPLGFGASEVPTQISQLEGSGACPPSGTHHRPWHSLKQSPGLCLRALCTEVTNYNLGKDEKCL